MDVQQAQRVADILGLDAGQAAELVDILSAQSTAANSFTEPVTISGSLPVQRRNYGECSGETPGQPIPPVTDPNLAAMLTLENAPEGDSDLQGDNGFALVILQGNMLNQGESWLMKFAQVKQTTTVTDYYREDLEALDGFPTLVTSTYYAADCVEVADSKGRALVDDTGAAVGSDVRIFQAGSSLPAENQVIPYLRDTNGLAWRLDSGGDSGAMAAAAAVGSWSWSAEGTLGVVSCTNGTTSFPVYLPATSAGDPNAHAGDVVQFYQSNGFRYAINCVDAKIGTIRMFSASGVTPAIPAGWSLYTALSGRFPVGYSGSGDYASVGAWGGNNPITPGEHGSSGGTKTVHTSTTHIEINEHELSAFPTDPDQGYGDEAHGGAHGHGIHGSSLEGIHTHVLQVSQQGAAAGTFYGYADTGATAVKDAGSHYHTTNITSSLASTHFHHLTTSHAHTIEDEGHLHTVNINHSHAHSEQDFRPPYRVTLFIVRVGPT